MTVYAILPVAPGADVSAALGPRGEFAVELAATAAVLPAQLDLAYATRPPVLTPQCLLVSGPSPTWLAYNTAPAVARAVGLGPLGASLTADRITRLTELVVTLCPLATTLVQPLANYMAVAAADFAADAAAYLVDHNPTPLWAYPRSAGGDLETTGMATFGLPELAMPITDAPAADAFAYALMRQMVDAGPLPVGAVIGAALGEVAVEAALHGALRCVPRGVPGAPARDRVARRRAFAQLLGPHARMRAAAAIDHYFLVGHAGAYAVTNGARPGRDLVVSARSLTGATEWLDWATQALGDAVGDHDRIVLPAPKQGIAGVIAWPFGHIVPETTRVDLWVLLPITPAELAAFRADPAAQGAWIAERETRRDVHEIEARWLSR